MTVMASPVNIEPRRYGAASATKASNLRDHNERSLLTLLRMRGPTAGAMVSRALGVSAQTASVILRSLEDQGLVTRLSPIKGKVGKPLVPYALNRDGAYSYGLRLGRRSADIALVNFVGDVVWKDDIQYPYPTPDTVAAFVSRSIRAAGDAGYPTEDKVAGLGIATPFELWNWLEGLGAPKEEADLWRDHRFETAFAEFTSLKVHVRNDVNLAANGELTFGLGREMRSFGYFYLGAFVGGAVVLHGRVFHGARGNAGAFGSIPTGDINKPGHQLIDQASIYRLEQALAKKSGRPVNLRSDTDLWSAHEVEVDTWLGQAASALGKAALSVAAVLDVSDFVLDGVFPAAVRAKATAAVSKAIDRIDQQGLHPVRIYEGTLGPASGVMGAAYLPILETHLLDGGEAYAV